MSKDTGSTCISSFELRIITHIFLKSSKLSHSETKQSLIIFSMILLRPVN